MKCCCMKSYFIEVFLHAKHFGMMLAMFAILCVTESNEAFFSSSSTHS